ncbi:MAG: hypothetical protein ABIH23_15455 [bacterium]
MGEFDAGSKGYAVLLEIKEDIGEMKSDLKKLMPLEERVEALEIAQAASKGAGGVRGKLWGYVWEAGRLVIAAFFGAYMRDKIGG